MGSSSRPRLDLCLVYCGEGKHQAAGGVVVIGNIAVLTEGELDDKGNVACDLLNSGNNFTDTIADACSAAAWERTNRTEQLKAAFKELK